MQTRSVFDWEQEQGFRGFIWKRRNWSSYLKYRKLGWFRRIHCKTKAVSDFQCTLQTRSKITNQCHVQQVPLNQRRVGHDKEFWPGALLRFPGIGTQRSSEWVPTIFAVFSEQCRACLCLDAHLLMSSTNHPFCPGSDQTHLSLVRLFLRYHWFPNRFHFLLAAKSLLQLFLLRPRKKKIAEQNSAAPLNSPESSGRW